ncbi:hypothetical protein FOA43_000773 [Brettanomyces nanus]|uniref:SH3 domain-containing protein n=1 Tax=Eeniella nana TaxID=13502 RepID=A0A875S012_EENNA|nr:uncharacterized protein FOA43_000773 [Brettanomyces nanus]QPG73462.1 hypothetical protein FOA43_000773 [Brettanomyces nanus]
MYDGYSLSRQLNMDLGQILSLPDQGQLSHSQNSQSSQSSQGVQHSRLSQHSQPDHFSANQHNSTDNSSVVIKYIPQDKQFTRKDLDIDEDRNEDLNMNYDFLEVPPRHVLTGNTALDGFSSSGSSQSSSTVIRPDTTDSKFNDTLKRIPLRTLETDREFTDRIRVSIVKSRLNAKSNSKSDSNSNTHEQFHMPPSPSPLPSPTDSEINDDKLNDYIDGILPSSPASPPRELDPSKMYALYDFNGPDPSHIELLKDDSVELLNDSDSYWWLVRRLNNGKVGFAPAEILETYGERLARLNCWKNEILEKGKGKANLSRDDLKLFEFNPSFTKHRSLDDLHVSDTSDNTGDSSRQSLNIDPPNTSVSSSIESHGGRVVSSSSSQLARKSSLKRAKSIVKKSVTFAGSLPNLPEEDTEEKQSVSSSPQKETMAPLVVPKRACKTNFLIKDLDVYNQKYQEIHSIIDPPPSPPFASSAGSIGSYSPSTNSDYDSEQDTWTPELKPKTKVKSKSSSSIEIGMKIRSFSENRADFLQKKTRPLQQNAELDKNRTHSDRTEKSDVPLSKSLQLLDDLIKNSPEFNSSREVKGSHFLDAAPATNQMKVDDQTIQKDQSIASTISSAASSTMFAQFQQLGDHNTLSSLTTADSFVGFTSSPHTSSSVLRTPTADTGTETNTEAGTETDDGSQSSGSTIVTEKLHPVTTEIFHPLMDHLEELEKMLSDMSINSAF